MSVDDLGSGPFSVQFALHVRADNSHYQSSYVDVNQQIQTNRLSVSRLVDIKDLYTAKNGDYAPPSLASERTPREKMDIGLFVDVHE